MDELIRKVIEEKIGRKVIKIKEYTHARVNKVYNLITTDLNLVIKIAPKSHDKYPDKFNIESYAFSLCRERDLPAPDIILIDKSRKIINTPYTISKKLFGDTLEHSHLSQDKLGLALQNAGRSLSIIHSIEIKGFGPLSSNNIGIWDKWSEIIAYKLTSLEKIYRYGIIDSKLSRKIHTTIDKKLKLAECFKPRLLHGDYNLTNILIGHKQNVTGIVDMENCYSGDPFYDLALFHYYYSRQNYLEQLLEGYSNINLEEGKSKILLYNILISISKLAWKYETKQFLDTIKPSISLLEKQINQLLHNNL